MVNVGSKLSLLPEGIEEMVGCREKMRMGPDGTWESIRIIYRRHILFPFLSFWKDGSWNSNLARIYELQ